MINIRLDCKCFRLQAYLTVLRIKMLNNTNFDTTVTGTTSHSFISERNKYVSLLNKESSPNVYVSSQSIRDES
jgi:hypothetical protein